MLILRLLYIWLLYLQYLLQYHRNIVYLWIQIYFANYLVYLQLEQVYIFISQKGGELFRVPNSKNDEASQLILTRLSPLSMLSLQYRWIWSGQFQIYSAPPSSSSSSPSGIATESRLKATPKCPPASTRS